MWAELFNEEKMMQKHNLRTEIKGYIQCCKEFNTSYDEVIIKVQEKYRLKKLDAEKIVNDYWTNEEDS